MHGTVFFILCGVAAVFCGNIPANVNLPTIPWNCREHLALAQASPLVGAWKPNCAEDGSYAGLQTYGSIGMSFCVDRSGTTIVPPQRGLQACKCPRARELASTGAPLVGHYVPQCQANGHYKPRQGNGSTGYTWCVNQEGEQVAAAVRPGQAGTLNC